MAKNKKAGKKRVTQASYTGHRLNPRTVCSFCQASFATRGIKRHKAYCSRNPANSKKVAISKEIPRGFIVPVEMDLTEETNHSLTDDGTSDNPSRLSDYRGPDNIEDYESCEETTSDTHPEHDRRDPSLSDHPARFISIVWHPSSNRPDEIIPLSGNADQDAAIPPSSDADLLPPVHGDRLPWHPFDTKGDFKFVHFVTTNRLKNKAVDQLLEEMHENREWTSGCTLSFKTHKDIELVLSKARVLFPEFRTEKISVKSGEYSFKFTLVLRNAWHWLESLVTDPIFASKINWYPCRKYLHEGDSCTRLYDDLETGDNWWDYQSDISPPNSSEPIPRCYLPIHFWSDKAKVSNQYSLHPVIMRPGFLPSVIRNGNGNGGGVLIAYLPVLPDLEDEASLDETSSHKRATVRRMMYHASMKVILDPLRNASHHGQAVRCGDKVVRRCYPGILVYSMDYEEATYALLNRGVNADFPDPKCNVTYEQQHDLTGNYTRRTCAEMSAAYAHARLCRFAYESNDILQAIGTYLIKNAFWVMRNSCPYKGWGYDILHMDDTSGKGKKIFLLVVEKVVKDKLESALNQRYSQLPRYPLLKHFHRVTDISYTDGNTIYNIIKNLVFCLVDLMPPNSPWVHLVRAYSRFRVLIGLHVMTDIRIELGKKLLQQENLSLDYPKYHGSYHVFQDIKGAGVTSNYVTKTGEGYNAEMKASHNQTNFKNVEAQMGKIDQNHEVIAHMMDWTLVANEKEESARAAERAENTDEPSIDSVPIVPDCNDHHKLGSKVSPRLTMDQFETANSDQPGFKDLAMRLANYLALGHHGIKKLPEFEGWFKLSFYRCAYVNYESKEDFRVRQDIIRCNPSFNGHPRYDTVLVDDNELRFARILAVFSWKYDQSKPPLDLALVRYFQPTSWTPATNFERCRVMRERRDTHFIYMSSIIRSCHMPPAIGKAKHFLVNDQTDGDIFLRLEETPI
ncbi:hypothetical protein SISNIDRAFT_480465 [Sistotremastrum niveocremeum HHB9708]|uniref:Uncharacterized protein n=1 Tax=Sistotremastrum niveocremeum HHB9708 TaxID=1314777 RepID=A0A165AE73_9AGAM|nr:hypothetical protein SISNIDRAFT_480465 [Sistotremastrum niveocremeum HHB9708]